MLGIVRVTGGQNIAQDSITIFITEQIFFISEQIFYITRTIKKLFRNYEPVC